MRIPSCKKIEAQAQAISLMEPSGLTPEEELEYQEIKSKRLRSCHRIDAARGGCPGGAQCTCSSNPEVIKLAAEEQPLINRLEALWEKQQAPQRAAYQHWRLILTQSRTAKEKWSRTPAQ